MKKLALLLIAAFLVGGCVPTTIITENETEVKILYGGGGVLTTKRVLYERYYNTDKKVIIDGMMISADAFYAFGIPDVCYTENVVWAPHAVSAGGIYRLGRQTDMIMLYLPDPLQEYFRNSSYYWNPYTVGGVYYDELLTLWPEGACNQKDTQ